MKLSAIPSLKQISVLFCLSVLCCKESHSKIFAYVDSFGKLVISRSQEEARNDARYKPFDPASRRALTKSATGTKNHRSDHDEKAQRYTDIIGHIAREVGINAHLLHAVIQVESAYNPAAISAKGAQGMMQLIPATAARFGVIEVHDPEDNIRGGARYLKNLLDRFNNDLRLTLAAYNAGEGAVQKYKNTIPPYPETQAYVTRVLDVFERRMYRERNSS